MAARLKMYLIRTLRELLAKPIDQLVDERYEKFRRMGAYLDAASTRTEAEQDTPAAKTPA